MDKPCTCYVIEDFRFGNPNKHKDSRRELVVRVRTDPYCAQHGWKYHKAGTEEYNIDVYIREYITKHFP